jgi:hypothetical protein
MIEISLHLGVPDNQISLHFRVPDNQISLHFGVPDNQISLHFEVPDNCSLKCSGGVRQSRSLTDGSTPQTEEHWGSPHKLRSTTLLYILHCTLYTVHCTLYTVHCILYTVHF